MLISLTHDIDLADDLLQETYLYARSGISGYRNENARAWLSTIAKNAFYMHVRRPSVRLETSADDVDESPDVSQVHPDRVLVIGLRQAIQELEPILRTALVMKHYGGFTYKEIGERQGCATGTAKWRVWSALEQLRNELAEEFAEMKCSDVRGMRMLDYLYGALLDEDMGPFKMHLERCQSCREHKDELRKVMNALVDLEGEHKMMHIVELSPEGKPRLYVVSNCINHGDQPIETEEFDAEKRSRIEHLVVQGEEMPFQKRQSQKCDHRFTYRVRLPKPLEPGQRLSMLIILQPSGADAKKQDNNRWRFWWGQCPSSSEDFIYAQFLRLPPGARLVNSDPEPDEIRSNGNTMLAWRRVLPMKTQFEFTVEYELQEQQEYHVEVG